jgi:hypothetical protein
LPESNQIEYLLNPLSFLINFPRLESPQMFLNNNNGSQTNQPSNDESFTQILPQIQMMLSAAMNQQAGMFQNTVKEMTQDIAQPQLKMTFDALQKQPTPPSS